MAFKTKLSAQRETDLIRRIACGRDDAFSDLFRTTYEPVLRYIRSRTGVRLEDAEEIALDTFRAVKDLAPTYNGTCTATTWLFSIARLKIASHARKRTQRRHIPPHRLVSLEDPLVSRLAVGEGQTTPDLDFLQTLTEQERQALTLRYVDQYSVRELARVLGRSEKAAESLLNRAKQKARTTLAAMGLAPPTFGLGPTEESLPKLSYGEAVLLLSQSGNHVPLEAAVIEIYQADKSKLLPLYVLSYCTSDFERTVHLYREAIASPDADPWAHATFGWHLTLFDRLDEAERVLAAGSKLTDRGIGAPTCRQNLAIVFALTGRLEQAEELLAEVLRNISSLEHCLEREHLITTLGIDAFIQALQGKRLHEALAQAQLLKNYPRTDQVWAEYVLGLVRFRMGLHELAIQHLQVAIQGFGLTMWASKAELLLGRAQEAMGRGQAAAECYERAIMRNANNAEAKEALQKLQQKVADQTHEILLP